ncbi:hypothetical protein VKT23_002723 [Stygiomarasmius scandens]|uniref:Uncharacterized protein n=1 Tax=Marasmiellus scandens TaxID=2682957 RepID=A0ABR1K389_9AGAR
MLTSTANEADTGVEVSSSTTATSDNAASSTGTPSVPAPSSGVTEVSFTSDEFDIFQTTPSEQDPISLGWAATSAPLPTSTQTEMSVSSVVKPRMGAGEKKLKGTTLKEKLRNSVLEWMIKTDEEMQRITDEYHINLHRVKMLMGIHQGRRGRRDNSVWNAAVHWKAQEVNAGRLKGSRYTMAEIHKLVKEDEDLMAIIRDEDSEEVQDMIKDLEDYQQDRFRGTRADERANTSYATHEFQCLNEQAMNLAKKTDAVIFGLICNSSYKTDLTLNYYAWGPIQDFLKFKFNMSPADFVQALEGYSCAKSAGREKEEISQRQRKDDITKWINEGLADITGNKYLHMEYTNYWFKLVKIEKIKCCGTYEEAEDRCQQDHRSTNTMAIDDNDNDNQEEEEGNKEGGGRKAKRQRKDAGRKRSRKEGSKKGKAPARRRV